MANKNLTIRIEENLLKKLHVVAQYEGRSANKQVIFMIRNLIRSYEAKFGEIETDDK